VTVKKKKRLAKYVHILLFPLHYFVNSTDKYKRAKYVENAFDNLTFQLKDKVDMPDQSKRISSEILFCSVKEQCSRFFTEKDHKN